MLVAFNINHLDEVCSIEKKSFPSPWSKDQFLSYCGKNSNSKSFVYIKQKNIIGYLMSNEILQEIHVHNIAVTREYRRMGIGSRMFLDFLDFFKSNSVKKLCLEVKDSNLSAIQFYIYHGFIVVGERKKYYEVREEKIDACLMKLKI